MDTKSLKKLTNEDKKEISLEILKDVSNFCENNNITYFLACGTLLGAIKYKGFIPWDDDIDIMMPRPDYNRFLDLYINQNYKLLKPSEGRYYYAKVYDTKTIKLEKGLINKNNTGVDIDIFPLDGIVNDKEVIDKIMSKSSKLELLLRLANQNIFLRKNPLKAINRIVPRIIGRKNLVRMIEKNAQTYDYDNSEYVIRVRNTPNGFSGALPKSIYEKDKAEFEGEMYYVPKGYDTWLKQFYGENYLTETPSEDKRRVHQNECYFVE